MAWSSTKAGHRALVDIAFKVFWLDGIWAFLFFFLFFFPNILWQQKRFLKYSKFNVFMNKINTLRLIVTLSMIISFRALYSSFYHQLSWSSCWPLHKIILHDIFAILYPNLSYFLSIHLEFEGIVVRTFKSKPV